MKTMKRTLCLALVLVTMCCLLVPVASAASTAPYDSFNSTNYARTYTLAASGRQTVYTASNLKTPGNSKGACNAWVDCSVDELWVFDVGQTGGTSWAYISYPGSGGTRRTGYIPLSAISANTHVLTATATGKFYCAPRKGQALSSSYYVAKNDRVNLIAVSGDQVQIIYPSGTRYRIAWAKKSDYEKFCGPVSNDPVDVTAQFAGKTITIRSVQNGLYLCADSNASGTPIRANKSSTAVWETFTVSSMTSDGWVGIKAHTGKWLRANAASINTPVCAADTLQKWECFRIYQKGSDYYLKAQVNNKWLCVRIDTNQAPVQAYASAPSSWERLDIRLAMDATQKNVQGHLDKIIRGDISYNDTTVMALGKKFTGYRAGEQCKGYAKNVFYMCFGIQPGSTQSKDAGLNYLLNSTAGMTKLGSVTNRDTAALAALFGKARPGDFVQMRRAHTGSHSAIVYSVSPDGVTFLEANLDNKNTVSKGFYTWDDLANNAAMSVYTATNYRLK